MSTFTFLWVDDGRGLGSAFYIRTEMGVKLVTTNTLTIGAPPPAARNMPKRKGEFIYDADLVDFVAMNKFLLSNFSKLGYFSALILKVFITKLHLYDIIR